LQCHGKVTFVSFHPRIINLCVIASNKDGAKNECNVTFYDYKKGEIVKKVTFNDISNIYDVQFEPVLGLIAALSSSNGIIKLLDIRNNKTLITFKCGTEQRDTKLFWQTNDGRLRPKYFTNLICLGFGKGSVRKFCLYDLSEVVSRYYDQNCNVTYFGDAESKENEEENVEEEQEENKNDSEIAELQSIASHKFGVSNAVPIGYYDSNDNLFYVSSVGDRKIRTFEFKQNKVSEMNASYQSKEDIQGICFGAKQNVNVQTVELIKCFKLTKDGAITPISFLIPRKRKEYFQDDLYSQVLDVQHGAIDILQDLDNKKKLNVSIKYLSLKPKDMELLSNAPQEKLTEHQKRRNSQIKLMEKSKLNEQPQSTEQAFDQFSRMVADAPTANRWDAQNIGTEVAEDEWSD